MTKAEMEKKIESLEKEVELLKRIIELHEEIKRIKRDYNPCRYPTYPKFWTPEGPSRTKYKVTYTGGTEVDSSARNMGVRHD